MLRHLSVRFDPIEDRLVLRLSLQTADGPVEHWLHLTRRLCVKLRKDLQAMVDMSAELPESMDRTAKAVVSSAHHQAMASQVRTRTERAPEPAAMPAEAPVLVTKTSCGKRRSDSRWVVQFELRDRPMLSLVLSNPTMHALVDALSRRVRVADWGLPELPADRAATPMDPSSSVH